MDRLHKALLKTPVLFVIFQRADLASLVFEEIRKARPAKLYVAADGPRNEAEAVLCRQARTVIDGIDWECELHTRFQDHNVGCRDNVCTSISWMFEKEEEGIILEDDCLPGASFFQYCTEMLEKYKDDETVGCIGGYNFLEKSRRSNSCLFTKYPFIWGWATWRRAWKFFDGTVPTFPETLLNDSFKPYFNSCFEKNTFYNKFYQVYKGRNDIWDYQWVYALWKNKMKSIIPPVNLVKNLGFDPRATHKNSNSSQIDVSVGELSEILPPQMNEIDKEADAFFYQNIYKRRFLANVWLLFKMALLRVKLK